MGISSNNPFSFVSNLRLRALIVNTKFKTSICLVVLFFSHEIVAQDLSAIGKQKPITLGGSIGASSAYYSATGIDNRQKPFTWSINGNLNAKIYGVEVPMYFILTEQQRSFTQPFNQFGLSPHYKWATVHLGYRSMNFSPYTLSGNTFLGVGVELNPGKIRFAAMKGRFQKAINEDTLSNSVITPTYKRSGYAMKVGYGTISTHLDLIYLKAGDDKESLNYIPIKSEILPQENTVIGFSGKATVKKKMMFDLDFASSEYRRNLYIEEGKISRIAMNAAAAYQFTNVNLKLQFKRIDPDYKSLGAAYINADIQEITFIPTINFLKKKARIQTSIGTQHDNLKNDKTITTNRLIFSINGSYQPIQSYGIDLIYSNYGISQSNGTQVLNDTIRISQTLSNFTINNRYTKISTKSVKVFVLTAIFQNTNDQNKFTQIYSESKSEIFNLTYVNTPINPGLNYNGSLMYTKVEVGTTTINNYGLTAGIGKDFFNRKLQAGTSASYFINKLDSKSDGKTICWNLNGNYRPHKNHQFNLTANFLNRITNDNLSQAFNEVRITAGYIYSF